MSFFFHKGFHSLKTIKKAFWQYESISTSSKRNHCWRVSPKWDVSSIRIDGNDASLRYQVNLFGSKAITFDVQRCLWEPVFLLLGGLGKASLRASWSMLPNPVEKVVAGTLAAVYRLFREGVSWCVTWKVTHQSIIRHARNNSGWEFLNGDISRATNQPLSHPLSQSFVDTFIIESRFLRSDPP